MSTRKRAYSSERQGLAAEPAVCRSMKHHVGLAGVFMCEMLADSGLTGPAGLACSLLVLNIFYFDTAMSGSFKPFGSAMHSVNRKDSIPRPVL